MLNQFNGDYVLQLVELIRSHVNEAQPMHRLFLTDQETANHGLLEPARYQG